jgi:hypothetical protein
MDRKFIIPISSMLLGLGVWLTYFVARKFSSAVRDWPPRAELAVALVTGALIVFSGFTCLMARGPAVGQVVRAGLLLILAGLTYWKVGAQAAAVLLFGALVLAVLAVVAFAGR